MELAKNQNLVIIPVVNKIDLPQARIEETKKEFSKLREKVLFTEPENLEVTFVEDEIAEIIEKEM